MIQPILRTFFGFFLTRSHCKGTQLVARGWLKAAAAHRDAKGTSEGALSKSVEERRAGRVPIDEPGLERVT